MICDDEAIQKFQAAKDCYICGKKLSPTDVTRDHCHFNGKFGGRTHSSCNLQYQISKKNYSVPIFIHNAKNYDTHMIVQAIKQEYGKIRLIPNNMEKYISLQIGMRIADSFQFLPLLCENW